MAQIDRPSLRPFSAFARNPAADIFDWQGGVDMSGIGVGTEHGASAGPSPLVNLMPIALMFIILYFS